MMFIAIRPAELAEAADLTALAQAGKRHWGYPEAWLEIWRESLTITPDYIGRNTVRSAEDQNGRVIGFYAVKSDDGEIWLEHLWLAPAFIGCGLGRKLFEHATQTARQVGGIEMLIEADPNAEGFYLCMGAARTGKNISRLTGTERVIPLLRFPLR